MTRRRFAIVVVYLPAVLAAAAIVTAKAEPPPKRAVHGHFVVLGSVGGETVPWARAVIEPGYLCPTVTGGASDVAMTSRDNPHSFPVIVCEARIGFDQTLALAVADGSLALPTVKRKAAHVLVFGDTGCKAWDADKGTGCKSGEPAEPFHSLAEAAAAGPVPDVILHMGDYNYRGTGGKVLFTEKDADGKATQVETYTYDAGDGSTLGQQCTQAAGAGFYSQNADNANRPDRWEYWHDDFFEAARELLPRAPWVFARGNHELCSRAGPGYFYFLDPRSNLGSGQLRCPEPDPRADPIDNVELSDPYAVALGDLTVLVLDSANACDYFTEAVFTGYYQTQLATLHRLAPAEGHVWLMGHRPLYGVGEIDDSRDTTTPCTGDKKWACSNRMLQTALGRVPGGLPKSVELLLSGHMHRFQSSTFEDGRPPMVVIGNSGVALDGSPPLGELEVAIDGAPAHVLSLGDTVDVGGGNQKPAFGYLDVSRQDGGWSGVVHNPPENLVLVHCGSDRAVKGHVCELAQGVSAE